jgi:predicted methyltransferase
MRIASLLAVLLAVPLGAALAACGPTPPPEVAVAPSATPTAAPTTEPPKPDQAPDAIEVPPRLRELVASPDRLPEDLALDAGRHPAELLAFFGVSEGMKVAELGAGGGYTAELLARAVGDKGVVYGHNTPFILTRFAEKPWSARLARPVMKNVKRVDREFDDPLPAEAKDLDAVFLVLFYHDLYWMKADRAKMNAGILRALKPGGVYAIVDHSAKEGRGAADVESLHRIEEKTLVEDVSKAGFVLEKSGSFLRQPDDPRDRSTSPGAAGARRGTSDRFVLLFRKPR